MRVDFTFFDHSQTWTKFAALQGVPRPEIKVGPKKGGGMKAAPETQPRCNGGLSVAEAMIRCVWARLALFADEVVLKPDFNARGSLRHQAFRIYFGGVPVVELHEGHA